MSFQDLRPYFQARMRTVDTDFYEWTLIFSEDNIPNSLMDKAYHINYGTFSLQGNIQNGAFNYVGPVTMNIYFKGYADPIDYVDTAWAKAEAIIQECCKHSNRLSQANIKNLLARNVSISQLGANNDSIIRVTITFECSLILGVS